MLYGAPRLNNMVQGDPEHKTGFRCYQLCADLFEPDSVAGGFHVCFVSFICRHV